MKLEWSNTLETRYKKTEELKNAAIHKDQANTGRQTFFFPNNLIPNTLIHA